MPAHAGCEPEEWASLKLTQLVRHSFWLLAFIAATVLTQVGGIAVAIVWFFARGKVEGPRAFRVNRALGSLFAVGLLYTLLTNFIVPPVAAHFGRVRLSCEAAPDYPLQAAHPLYCWLNRNYVDVKLRELALALANDMRRAHPGTISVFLDANFPFLNGFPLLPHLSHDDGRKLDLAFYYRDERGEYVAGVTRSPIGYWAFEQPRASDPLSCERESWLSLRWNMTWLQPLFPNLQLDETRTAAALRWLVEADPKHGLERILIEPHLATRLGVSSPLIRFQGCRAARHDDHIHIQIAR